MKAEANGQIIIVLSLIIQGNLCQTENPKERLVKRNEIRAAVAGKLDPNFWPARGRRSDFFKNGIVDFEFPIGNKLQDDFRLRARENSNSRVIDRGGKSNDEESGVFWAGRGRNVPFPMERSSETEADDTFWANRGRSIQDFNYNYLNDSTDEDQDQDESSATDDQEDDQDDDQDEEVDTRWRRHRLFVEEPGWIWLTRRESRPGIDVSFVGGSHPSSSGEKGKVDLFWVARGKKHKKEKREINSHKSDPSCRSFHPKRNSKNVVRDLTHVNQNTFWPARGKRPLSSAAERELALREMARGSGGSFWPARGKRPFAADLFETPAILSFGPREAQVKLN